MRLENRYGENIFHEIFMLKRLETLKAVNNLYFSSPDIDDEFRLLLFRNFFGRSLGGKTILQFLYDYEIDSEKLGGTRDFGLMQLFADKIECDAIRLCQQRNLPQLQEQLARYQFHNQNIRHMQLSNRASVAPQR